jgi:hypothetical protein
VNTHYYTYSEFRGGIFRNALCYFGPYNVQYNVLINRLDLVFIIFSHIDISNYGIDLVTPDNYTPLCLLKLVLLIAAYVHIPRLFRNHDCDDYAVFPKFIV